MNANIREFISRECGRRSGCGWICDPGGL